MKNADDSPDKTVQSGFVGQLPSSICSSSCQIKRQKAGVSFRAALQSLSYKAVLETITVKLKSKKNHHFLESMWASSLGNHILRKGFFLQVLLPKCLHTTQGQVTFKQTGRGAAPLWLSVGGDNLRARRCLLIPGWCSAFRARGWPHWVWTPREGSCINA